MLAVYVKVVLKLYRIVVKILCIETSFVIDSVKKSPIEL